MIKRLCLLIILAVVPILAAHHNVVFASAQTEILGGVKDANGGNAPAAPATVNDTITTIVNLLSFAVGIAAVIMIIVGGFRYVTSAGNAEGAKSAKNTILYAIIGLVVAGLAQVVVHFVLGRVG